MPTKFLPTSRRVGSCPICGNASGDCRLPADGDFVLCQSTHEEINHPDWKYIKENGGQSAGVWGVFAPRLTEKVDRQEYDRQRLRLQHERQKRLEEEAQQYRSGLSRHERDANIRRLSAALGLKSEHRQQLKNRGLTTEQIDKGLFFSIAPNYPAPNTVSEKLPGIKLVGDRRILAASKSGIACVAFDHAGLAIGFQLRDENPNADNKYLWAKSTFSSHLQTGEMPITTHGKIDKWVMLTEGILKPLIAHSRLSIPVIGASNGGFVGSPLQFRAAIGKTRTLAIALDGGDIINPHVLGRWQTFLESYSYPYTIYFCWWGQWQKSDSDIDEVAPQTWQPEWLSPDQMGELIANNATVNFWIVMGRLDLAIKLLSISPFQQ